MYFQVFGIVKNNFQKRCTSRRTLTNVIIIFIINIEYFTSYYLIICIIPSSKKLYLII